METENPQPKKKSNMKAIGIVVVALLVAAGIFIYGGLNFGQSGNEVLAELNSETITKADIEAQINQLVTAGFIQQLPPKNSEEYKQLEAQLLEQMVYDRLLLQEAKNRNFSANQTEIDTQYNLLISQVGGEELLETELANVGVTRDELMKNISTQIIMGKFYESLAVEYNITVTDEEVAQFFDDQIPAEELAGLDREMLEGQIRDGLRQRKLETPLMELVERLIQEGNVQIYI